MHKFYSNKFLAMERELKLVKDDFTTFKQKNDLDIYFSKNLNDDTRKRVLKEVEELNRQTEFIAIDNKILEKCNEANVKGMLESIVDEYNNYIKARIQIFTASILEVTKNED